MTFSVSYDFGWDQGTWIYHVECSRYSQFCHKIPMKIISRLFYIIYCPQHKRQTAPINGRSCSTWHILVEKNISSSLQYFLSTGFGVFVYIPLHFCMCALFDGNLNIIQFKLFRNLNQTLIMLESKKLTIHCLMYKKQAQKKNDQTILYTNRIQNE